MLMHIFNRHTNLVDIGTGFGRSLHIADPPLLSTRLCLVCADLPSVVQVRFVANQEEGHILILLHSQNLLSAKSGNVTHP